MIGFSSIRELTILGAGEKQGQINDANCADKILVAHWLASMMGAERGGGLAPNKPA
jgi:hypothetical protein